MRDFNHYYKNVATLDVLDVYRVLRLFDVTDPALQHAVKKILCAGGRGLKEKDRDINEAIASLMRWQEMREEDDELEGIRLARTEAKADKPDNTGQPENLCDWP